MKMRTLCVIIVCCVALAALARASRQIYPPRPQCKDERVDMLWAGLLRNVPQLERAPFRVEMEHLGLSTGTDCGVQFNGELCIH